MIETIEEVIRRLQKPRPGRAVLFVGAGFSDQATNRLGNLVPKGREFARQLSLDTASNPDLPLTLSSQIYNRKSNNRNGFLQLIRDTFTVTRVPDFQMRILDYPWKRLYTTNFDDLIEHVKFPSGMMVESYTRSVLPMRLEDYGRRQVIHLNGFVGSVNRDTVVDDFALTLNSYFDLESYQSSWASILRQDFLIADIIVFIGYSMYDPNVANLIGSNPHIKSKTAIFEREGISEPERLYLSEFGSVFPIGLGRLADLVSSVLAEGDPLVSVKGAENFEEVTLPSNANEQVSDRDIDALLVRGVYSREKFFSSRLSNSREYLIHRSSAVSVAKAVMRSNSTSIIHCDFGNGKTLFIEQVIYELLINRYRVFIFDRKTDNFSYDIEFFSQMSSENYVLVIEEIIANEDVIDAIRSQLSEARIVVSSRTSAFDLKSAEIRSIVDNEAFVYSVDKLGSEDIDSAIKILDRGGYWGRLAEVRSTREKRRFVEQRCRSELSSLLIGAVSSEYLDERLQVAFGRSRYDVAATERGILLALCMNIVEIVPTYEFISELIGVDIFTTVKSFDNMFLKQFFAIDALGIRARSPIMSEYILRNIISDDLKIDVILKATKVASDKHLRAKRYRELNSKFMQFSFIEKIVRSENNRYERIQDFYDRVGELGFKDFSPHYWLQYAIAARAFRDYRSADRYFGQTKKIMEQRPDFYTYKVDNAYAQFLLESRRDTDFWGDYFDAFAEASTLALAQTRNKKTGLYPYKVASMFMDYVETRGGRFTSSQINHGVLMLEAWSKQIGTVPKTGRNKKMLSSAASSVNNAMDYLIGSRKNTQR